MSTIDVGCSECHAREMHLQVKVAECDENLLDIVLTCSECDHCINAFVAIDEMVKVRS